MGRVDLINVTHLQSLHIEKFDEDIDNYYENDFPLQLSQISGLTEVSAQSDVNLITCILLHI